MLTRDAHLRRCLQVGNLWACKQSGACTWELDVSQRPVRAIIMKIIELRCYTAAQVRAEETHLSFSAT
jgi:hypothetical protein